MSRIDWRGTDGAHPIPQETRDQWVEDMVRTIKGTRKETSFAYCGDTLVVVVTDADGDIEVLDAKVRRRGLVSR